MDNQPDGPKQPIYKHERYNLGFTVTGLTEEEVRDRIHRGFQMMEEVCYPWKDRQWLNSNTG